MNIKYDASTKLIHTAGISMFLSTLDSGIVNITIPQLLNAFHTSINVVIWTVTLYTLVLSSSILLFGRLADRFGRIKIYTLGLGLFSLSSFLCGTASNIVLLIVYRGIQGLSAGMMQATALTLITTRLKSHDLIKAMASLGMIISMGPMLAPILGGLILNTLGWRWIFWLNIPITLLGLYYCYGLRNSQKILESKPIPVLNLLFMVMVLFFSLFTLNSLNNLSMNVYISIIVASIFFVLYFITELRTKNPIVPFSLFRKLSFTTPIMGIMAFGGATTGIFMLPPLYFQTIRGFEMWQV